jgi:diguanylate cyclase (GGDEF)-like protein
VYRESCGCVFRTSVTASVNTQAGDSNISLDQALPGVLAECRKSFKVIGEALGDEKWLDKLIRALRADLEHDPSNPAFLSALKTAVAKGSVHGLDTQTWTEFLYLLFNLLAPYIPPEIPLPRQAFFVMNQLTEANAMFGRMQYEEQTLLLYRSYQRMAISLDAATMREIAGYAIPRMQIDSCYISTYADRNSGLQGTMRPVIAIEDGRNVIARDGSDFPAAQIVPGGLKLMDKRFSFAVYALFFEHDQVGYAVYDMSRNPNSSIYEALTSQLSGILKASALLDEARHHAMNLETEVRQRTGDLLRKTGEIERLNEELIRKNRIDGLTALYNRGAFFEFVRGEVNRIRRMQQKIRRDDSFSPSFCIMMLDIDHFKLINDTYGHLVGDRVLQQIGEMLNNKKIFRREDIAGRFGGEEFIAVLTNAGVKNALAPAQKLAKELAATDFKCDDGRKFKVTVSIGISQYYSDDPNEEAVINRADKALYHAKETGRNTIVVYEEAFPPPGK